jgi:homoserine kinase
LNSFKIYVPATTTNLGPGFDVLGIALNLCNIFKVIPNTDGKITIDIEGEGHDVLPRNEDNLFIRAMKKAFEEAGEIMPGVHLHQKNSIPLNRGLGSSASAALGGLLAAKEMLKEKLPDSLLEQIAVEMEGHPDNIITAYKGGAVINYVADNKYEHIKLIPPNKLKVVVLIPPFPVETKKARAILPDNYSKADIVENLRNISVLVYALTTGNYDLLKSGCRDRIHQPYRAKLIPGLFETIEAAENAGAHGAYLSGSGSTIAALCTDGADSVALAMKQKMEKDGIETRTMITEISETGSYIENGVIE